jgi:hypothetical protein
MQLRWAAAEDHSMSDEELAEPECDLDRLAYDTIGAAIEVHRVLGPGFLEAVYADALAIELEERSVPHQRQVPLPIEYKGQPIA